jgi:signal transduction histidine kinase
MQSTISSRRPPFPTARLLKDMRLAVIINLLCALVITLINGTPRNIHNSIVYSMCIGTIFFLMVDVARLAMKDWAISPAARWTLLFGILLFSAPVSQFSGTYLASRLMGHNQPTLDDFASPREVSMVGFTLVAGGAAILLFAYRERMARIEAEAANQKARAEMIERQALQAQLQLLQAQVEPHMLFNTLANVQGLIALDPDRARHMLDQLIQYLRATLSSSRAEATTLAQEFALIDAYLGLMSVRMGERLSYRLDLPEALRDTGVPPMLLQPLVENAIIHGLEPTVAGGEIHVAAGRRGELLELCVSDSGLGLAGASCKAGTGVGVANTRDRLQGLYGARARLDLEPAVPQGTVARLTLPLTLS